MVPGGVFAARLCSLSVFLEHATMPWRISHRSLPHGVQLSINH